MNQLYQSHVIGAEPGDVQLVSAHLCGRTAVHDLVATRVAYALYRDILNGQQAAAVPAGMDL